MMTLQFTQFGYDFYTGTGKDGDPVYNLVPAGHPAPAGGYYNSWTICRVKGVPNMFL